jgi:hypothetical protein
MNNINVKFNGFRSFIIMTFLMTFLINFISNEIGSDN